MLEMLEYSTVILDTCYIGKIEYMKGRIGARPVITHMKELLDYDIALTQGVRDELSKGRSEIYKIREHFIGLKNNLRNSPHRKKGRTKNLRGRIRGCSAYINALDEIVGKSLNIDCSGHELYIHALARFSELHGHGSSLVDRKLMANAIAYAKDHDTIVLTRDGDLISLAHQLKRYGLGSSCNLAVICDNAHTTELVGFGEFGDRTIRLED